MSDLVSKVDQAIQAHHLFERDQFILVAVSGGLDSMVLLHVLHQLADAYGWMPVVAHFNHQLRGPESGQDAEFVKQSAARLGLKFVSEGADVKTFACKHKLSVEMGGRKLRHEFLARTAISQGIRTVALGHHADDQVELFFLRLLRGAGGEGLAGMRWINASPSHASVQLARPFLQISKEELQSYAEREGIGFRPDATNFQLNLERNRIRHELLPLLREKFQPSLSATTLRVMEIVGAESSYVRQMARLWEYRQRDMPFDQLHVAVQRQWLQLELLKLNVTPEFDLIERLRSAPGQVIMVHPRLSIWRNSKGDLQSRPVSEAKFNPEQLAVDVSAEHGEVVFGGLRIRWQLENRPSELPELGLHTSKNVEREAASGCEHFDAAQVGSRIVLRHWQPGDRFQPTGMDAPVKLQNLFTNRKVPRGKRGQLVVAATGSGEIFWVEGLRIAARFKLSNETARWLRWMWRRD